MRGVHQILIIPKLSDTSSFVILPIHLMDAHDISKSLPLNPLVIG